MNREKKLVKNTAIVAVGNICTKMWIFLLLPLYTSILTTEEYGFVELITTYVNLLLPIVILQIGDAIFRFTIDTREDEAERGRIISSILLFCISQCLLFTVIWHLICGWIPLDYKEFLYLNVIVNVFSNVLRQLCRGVGDTITYSVSSFLIAASAIIGNIIFVLFMDMRAEGLLMATFLSHIIGTIYILFKKRLLRQIKFTWFDWSLLKRMLGYSLPLVPNYLCWWVLGASDKTVVGYFLGVSYSGILSVSQKFSTAYTTIYNVFNLTWTESAALHKDDADMSQFYTKIIETAFRLLEALCFMILAGVALFFPLLVNEKFDSAYYQIPIYLLAAFFHSVIGIVSVVYIAQKKTAEIARTSFYAAMINLFVCVLSIGRIGLYAASISSVSAYLILLCIRYKGIQRYAQIKFKNRTLLSFAGMLLVSFILYYMRSIWTSILLFGIVTAYAIYINRSVMQDLINIIKRKFISGEKI